MTEAQKRLADLKDRQSRERGRMAELSLLDELTDEHRSELDRIENGTPDLERLIRAAAKAVETEDAQSVVETRAHDKAETELLELRSRFRVGNYLKACMTNKPISGAEAEYIEERQVPDQHLPFDVWEGNRGDTARSEIRAVTPTPASNLGVNLSPLLPAVFAPSLAGYLMVDMPMVASGAYATGRITTPATAGAVARTAEVVETAAAWETFSTTAHRVGASLNLSVEDIANVGTESFEPILRQHISLVVSNELNDLLLNGTGAGADPVGFIKRLADIENPTDPTNIVNFDSFLAAYSGQIDGLWAEQLEHVRMLVGNAAYQLATRAFRDSTGQTGYRGDTAFSSYAGMHAAGMKTSALMPAAASSIERAIAIKVGMNFMPQVMRLAECPTWGSFSIDDIYTGARAGTRRLVISALIGDLILTQPDAYSLVEFKVS